MWIIGLVLTTLGVIIALCGATTVGGLMAAAGLLILACKIAWTFFM